MPTPADPAAPAPASAPAAAPVPLVGAAVLQARQVGLRRQLPDGPVITILDRVDLDAHPGELLCLSGRSGSGKTSLLHIIAGLLRPDTGQVLLHTDNHDGAGSADGEAQHDPLDIWALEDTARSDLRAGPIAYVLQNAGLIDTLTAAENVLLGSVGKARRNDNASVDKVLAAVGLTDRAHNRPRALSGGERQRVAFARALLGQPRLVLLDEPTASLDHTTAQSIIALIHTLAHDRGLAVIAASHDPAVITAADREHHLAG